MALLDPRNGPDWDLPERVPTGTWVMASVPRCGSTLLCRALWDTGLVGAPKEYLNPMQIRDWEVRLGGPLSRLSHRILRGPAVGLAGRGWWPDRRLRVHLDRVQRRRTGPTGWFGLKIHWHHLEQWFVGPTRDPVEWLEARRWVWIRRDDRLAQAVSWARALQTGSWASTQQPLRAPRYRRHQITERLAAVEAGEAAWQRFFADRRLEPLVLSYEETVEDLGGAVRRVLSFLDAPEPTHTPAATLRPQADQVNADWIQRYRSGR